MDALRQQQVKRASGLGCTQVHLIHIKYEFDEISDGQSVRNEIRPSGKWWSEIQTGAHNRQSCWAPGRDNHRVPVLRKCVLLSKLK